MIKQLFVAQASRYTVSPEEATRLWRQLETAYTEPNRYYHNLHHLEVMLHELLPVQNEISDWETLFFSLCYHDAVYDVAQHIVQNDNEERSAAFAEKQLLTTRYPQEKIERCKKQILSTKTHLKASHPDTNFLVDADLCILGQPWEDYLAYRTHVRKEYFIYPDTIFYASRKKMLQRFLRAETIYKTAHFQRLYEDKARENLRKEYRLLQA